MLAFVLPLQCQNKQAMKNTFLSAITSRANKLATQFGRSEAMKMAWAAERLEASLKSSASTMFEFIKQDGTRRQAVGTKILSIVMKHWTPVSTKEENPLIVRYFDLEKLAWRSCRIDRLAA